jgi:hypothetical protein
MSEFYGKLEGTRGVTARQGNHASGITADLRCMSINGQNEAIDVELHYVSGVPTLDVTFDASCTKLRVRLNVPPELRIYEVHSTVHQSEFKLVDPSVTSGG